MKPLLIYCCFATAIVAQVNVLAAAVALVAIFFVDVLTASVESGE